MRHTILLSLLGLFLIGRSCHGVSLTDVSGLCSGKEGQRIPGPYCDTYYECGSGTATYYKCNEGESYNPDTKGCDSKDAVYCENGTRGYWTTTMQTGGVIAIHCALVPFTSKVIAWHRAAPWMVEKPQPGMSVPGSENLNMQGLSWEYLSAIQDPINNKYKGLPSTPPFCSGASLLPDGKIFVCGGDLGIREGRQDPDGDDICRLFGCSSESLDSCSWTDLPTPMSVPRWYPTQMLFPPYDDNGHFTYILGGSKGSVDPLSQEDVDQGADLYWSTSQTFQRVEPFDFAKKVQNLNMYPFLYLMPWQVDKKYVFFQWAGSYGELATMDNPKTNSAPISTLRPLPPLVDSEGTVTPTYPAGGCAVFHPLFGPDFNQAKVTIFGGHSGEFKEFADFPKILKSNKLASKAAFTIDLNEPNSKWEVEDMPDNAMMRDCIPLPTGKILLVSGTRRGRETSSNNGRGCAKEQVYQAWMYNPLAPVGSRWTVDGINQPTYRAYHGCALLLPDGSIYSGGTETDPVLNDSGECDEYGVGRNYHYNIDGYVPHDNFQAIMGGTRPRITYAPEAMSLGGEYSINYEGDVDECSLVTPSTTTHLMNMSVRVAILYTVGTDTANKIITVKLPYAEYQIMKGPTMLYCMYKREAYSPAVWVTIK